MLLIEFKTKVNASAVNSDKEKSEMRLMRLNVKSEAK